MSADLGVQTCVLQGQAGCGPYRRQQPWLRGKGVVVQQQCRAVGGPDRRQDARPVFGHVNDPATHIDELTPVDRKRDDHLRVAQGAAEGLLELLWRLPVQVVHQVADRGIRQPLPDQPEEESDRHRHKPQRGCHEHHTVQPASVHSARSDNKEGGGDKCHRAGRRSVCQTQDTPLT